MSPVVVVASTKNMCILTFDDDPSSRERMDEILEKYQELGIISECMAAKIREKARILTKEPVLYDQYEW